MTWFNYLPGRPVLRRARGFWCLTVGLIWAGCQEESPLTPPPMEEVFREPRVAPLITEIVAKNQSGLRDEDGALSDWIEIYNPDKEDLDLGGYHLTDNRADPKRWAFPKGTLLAKGSYLVVFASSKNRTAPGKPLHTNFSLSSSEVGRGCSRVGGEYLALTDKDGEPVSPVWDPFPPQVADLSYGKLSPEVTSLDAYFQKATPGEKNDLSSALTERVTIEPSSRMFAADTPLLVKLSVRSQSATVRYTTNHSRPIDKPGMLGTFQADAQTGVGTLIAHGLVSGDPVRVSGPPPLLPGGTYFVQVLSNDTFRLTVEPGGPGIVLADSGPFEIRRDAASGTAATSDLITSMHPHTFFQGDAVQIAEPAPGGLSEQTIYYIVSVSAGSFRLSPSPTLAPIADITTAGPIRVYRVPSPVYTAPLSLSVNTEVRARAFEPGRPSSPQSSEVYFAMNPAAKEFTSTLPIVVSTTWNTSMPNNVPVMGHVMVFEPQKGDNLSRLTGQPDLVSPCSLERHGSSTASEAKFTMVLELQDENGIDKNCRPLDLPLDSDWVLHAPYRYDRSMIHNDLVYRLSNDIKRYAPRTKFVEHFHNEQSSPDTIEGEVLGMDYFGVYSFMEKIKRGSERVDIENLTIFDEAEPAIQGGYIFKADRLDPGERGILPLPGQNFADVGQDGAGANILALVNPREISFDPFKKINEPQSTWLRTYLGEACAVLRGPDFADELTGYARYWDVPSMVDHHILNVASKNVDAFRLSGFYHKGRNGKIQAGPVWDFDRAMGSIDSRSMEYATWHEPMGTDYFGSPWYKEMFNDLNFWQAWVDRMEELRKGPLAIKRIHALIDELANQLNPGDAVDTPAKRSIARWPLSTPRRSENNTGITNNLFNGEYAGEIAWLKYWWAERLQFIDSQLTRPAVAEPPAGKVAIGTNITLSSPSEGLPGVRIYYTTDGTDPRSRSPDMPLSKGAIEYTGPIAITGATTLFVRVWNPLPPSPVASPWSAPAVFVYTP